ncbi:MAG TPA: TerB family tellurite resistance protein, partial [Aggregatilineales bacterium]|nr:TerB family tellurite resistance protein [Aggregatilineales bacterium]
MLHFETIRALGRLLIALAWEDGEVTPEEMNLVKDILFRLPEITPEDWRELEIYWMTPIRRPQLEMLGEQLSMQLTSESAKQAAYDVLVNMINADGKITSEETAMLREAKRAIDRVEPGLVNKLGLLLQTSLPRRAKRLADTSNREDYVDDFLRNRVFQSLTERFGVDAIQRLGLSNLEMRKLALTGALMGRVAYADYDIDDEELSIMETILQKEWSLHSAHAALVVEFAVDAAQQQLDHPRLTREFFEATNLQERIDFL